MAIYTLSEVAQHNTKESCWFVIKGKVYDATKFIEEHPGGPEVMVDNAGTDATIAFGDVGHSKDAVEMLEDYYIGELKAEEAAREKAKPVQTPSKLSFLISTRVWDVLVPTAVGLVIFAVYKRYAARS